MPSNIDKIVYPSLSSDGFLFSSIKQADAIMAAVMASDYSQSYLFNQRISSFGWLVATYNNQPDALITEMTRMLQILFERYFNGVIVECTDVTNSNSPSQFILGIYVEFQTKDGNIGKISQLAQINGSKFKLINNVISQGE